MILNYVDKHIFRGFLRKWNRYQETWLRNLRRISKKRGKGGLLWDYLLSQPENLRRIRKMVYAYRFGLRKMRGTPCVSTLERYRAKWDIMDVKKANLKPCPVCKGLGKVIAGYGVICMEIVEKVKKCPACNGIASWSQIAALKGDLTLF